MSLLRPTVMLHFAANKLQQTHTMASPSNYKQTQQTKTNQISVLIPKATHFADLAATSQSFEVVAANFMCKKQLSNI